MRRLTEERVVEAIGKPLEEYAHQCHAASLALVRSGIMGPHARVARGTLPRIVGQHSWLVVGNPYEPDLIVDITAWSYDPDLYPRVYVSVGGFTEHRPHGAGSIYDWGVPQCGTEPDIPLAVPISRAAQVFLDTVARRNGRSGLDRRGWGDLVRGPMQGWPSKEIIPAILDTPGLAALVPIDITGMLTDRNPGGLYLAGPSEDDEEEQHG